MKNKLNEFQQIFNRKIELIEDETSLEALRLEFLGKKGSLKAVLTMMKDLPNDQKPVIGKLANEIRNDMEEKIAKKKQELELQAIVKMTKEESIDITLPGKKIQMGSAHPITKTIDELLKIFVQLGFTPMEGPEIESVYNNFDALNAPSNHPSRDESDTFYIDDQRVLRTQTSPVQIRAMKQLHPPIKMVSIGRCFRNDSFDATHSPMFYQMEGLLVSEHTSMAELKGLLEVFIEKFFGKEVKSVFRPHNFPFTEPSAEIDISCFKCGAKGCKFCDHTGYIEILGCGMVHPNVLEACGIDSERYRGFAFGMGIDRITMLKYEIDDIRLLYENDQRFSRQFRR